MLLMDYPSIRGEEFPDYTKKATRNLFYSYIYAHSQRLVDTYLGDKVQAITRLQYQCANMTFYDQNR